MPDPTPTATIECPHCASPTVPYTHRCLTVAGRTTVERYCHCSQCGRDWKVRSEVPPTCSARPVQNIETR